LPRRAHRHLRDVDPADQDCCSLFVPPHPATRATAAEVAAAESLLDVDALVARGVAAAERETFVFPPPVSARDVRESA